MLKIMENLLESREEKLIARIIKETRTGRNSAFKALKWLEENGLVKITKQGNQKIVKIVLDNYTLQFKNYLDAITLKTLEKKKKLIMRLIAEELSNKKEVKAAIFFGSATKSNAFNEIDILLLSKKQDKKIISSLKDFREKIERIFDLIINFHTAEHNTENIFKGIIIYQDSFIKEKHNTFIQYNEFLEWTLQAIKNQNNKEILRKNLENAKVNLAYTYCLLNNLRPATKNEAKQKMNKKYQISNIKELKKTGEEIGKEIFK